MLDVDENSITINVGPLTGFGSLCMHVATGLKRYSERFQAGAHPQVEWDLQNVESRRISMASLTAFLSIAHRMRKFTGRPCRARVRWNPDIFGFWDDISFLRLAREFELFEWVPEDILGGYSHDKTNPNTRIIAFDYQFDVPPRVDLPAWIQWKDEQRFVIKEKLGLWCGDIFRPKRSVGHFDARTSDQIAVTTAELALNSLLWGEATAFVGLQRTSKGITVAACDCGKGLLRTINEKSNQRDGSIIKTHLDAIVFASLCNFYEWGLRRAIDTITGLGGWVMISTSENEVRWNSWSWERAKESVQFRDNELTALPNYEFVFPASESQLPRYGYRKTYTMGMRGVRVAFEIPLYPSGF